MLSAPACATAERSFPACCLASFSDNADLDAAVVANDAVIAAYASRADRPELPFWPLLFANVTLRLLGSDDFSQSPPRRCAPPRPARALG